MTKCKVHGIEFRSGRIRIRRGFPPAPPAGYFDAMETLFPFARSFETGGCVIDEADKDEKRVRFCPSCRDAELSWVDGRETEDFWLP